MNSLKCPQCGDDLAADPDASKRPPCPRCGHPFAQDESPTVVVSGGSPVTLKPARQGDTDANAGGMRTVAFASPGTRITGGPATTPSSELYDFLSAPERPDEIGRLGAYRVLKVLGAGGMGVVYEAEDSALQRRVAVKAMLPALAVSASARQRFLREARAAAAIEHERIVQIFQVGEDHGVPFLVMPLLKGESLEDRLNREGRLSVNECLRVGREIAEALAAAHERGLVHRDIKPANVWLEGTKASVKLLDFGLARAAESDTPLTQQGSIVGTPAFMAPEQASGENIDARTDLFSLGCVLYRITTGWLPFQGASAISILMAIVGKQPTPPSEVLPGMPAALSQLIMQLLAKSPAERPASAQAVIEILQSIPASPEPAGGNLPPVTQRTTLTNSEKISTVIMQPVAAGNAPKPAAPAAGPPAASWKWRILLGVAILAVVLGAAALLIPLLLNRPPVEIGIAYGTEKQQWFAEAVADFAATPEGKNIKINLIPLGSVEGGQAVAQHEDERIHVWSPASALYKDAFVRDWQSKHPGANPILKKEDLCMTPMVFVFWKDRYDAFVGKYKIVSFQNIGQAMDAEHGWGDIAGKPAWGRFNFGHTDPEQSNSGLVTLLLLACDANRDRPLTAADLADAGFQKRIAADKRGLARTSNSTGNLMKDMVTKGPAAFDAVMVYENLAIDYLKAARGRSGDLHVAYPQRNMWNDNPYYILDVPWSSADQRRAAETFLAFLMSEPMQKKALAHGFRPANINIPIRDDPASPFVKHKDSGLEVNISALCAPPGDRVVEDLLKVWRAAK